MSRPKRSPIAVRRKRGVCIEVVNDGETVATVEIDNDAVVTISTDPEISREAAKALATAIVQACEEYEREVRP